MISPVGEHPEMPGCRPFPAETIIVTGRDIGFLQKELSLMERILHGS
jgi:hypothetical protein